VRLCPHHSFRCLHARQRLLPFGNDFRVVHEIRPPAGFATALLSLAMALGYLIYKLVFWDQFTVGVAPLVIGLFFLSSVQLFFVGIVGEYIGSMYTQVRNHPHVFEKERINFEDNDQGLDAPDGDGRAAALRERRSPGASRHEPVDQP